MGGNIVEKTKTGSIVSFNDGSGYPFIDLTTTIVPIQDLHGYNAPWVGGAGKNKFAQNLYANGSGNNATWTRGTDGSITVSATSQVTTSKRVDVGTITLPAGTYVLSGISANDAQYLDIRLRKTSVTGSDYVVINNANPTRSFTLTEETTLYGVILIIANYNATTRAYPMIRKSTDSADYEPYENICPISGHTDVVVSRTGKNLCDTSLVYNGYINVSQRKIASNANARTLYLPCKPNTAYTVSKQAGQRFVVAESTAIPTNDVVVSNIVSDYYTASSITITTSATAKYLVAFVYLSTADTGVTADQMLATCQIELGSTATTYEPYQGDTYTTALGTTVYGGTLDVTTGVLTVDRAIVTYDGSDDETWDRTAVAQGMLFRHIQSDREGGEINTVGAYCNRFKVVANANRTNGTLSSPPMGNDYALDFIYNACSTVAEWRTWLGSNNVQVVYPLATPTTTTLTAQQISTLLGQNNVWASTGIITLTYVSNESTYYLDIYAGSTTATMVALPSPVSIKSSYELIWSENTGRAQSGSNQAKMIGDVVAEKNTYQIEWGVITDADMTAIRSKLTSGFFYFAVDVLLSSAKANAKKYYRSEIQGEILYIGNQKYWKGVSVSVIEQ